MLVVYMKVFRPAVIVSWMWRGLLVSDARRRLRWRRDRLREVARRLTVVGVGGQTPMSGTQATA